MKQTHAVVQCPSCGRTVEWKTEQRWRPFCSERCKLIDLGEWLDEEKRIPGTQLPQSDSDTSE